MHLSKIYAICETAPFKHLFGKLVTKNIEAVESLEKIIKQNFLETDKIILRLQKVQDINSRKFNWFLFIQTILFVLICFHFGYIVFKAFMIIPEACDRKKSF